MRTKNADDRERKSGAPAKPVRKAAAKDGSTAPKDPGDRLEPSHQIDRHIAGITDWRGNVLARIRRIMREADPAVTEDWKWMGTPVWYCDGMISSANPHIGKVKWTFAKGAHLADPEHLFNAGLEGNQWRAIDFFEQDRLNEAALGRLVTSAIAYNRSQRKAKEENRADKSAAKKALRVTKKV